MKHGYHLIFVLFAAILATASPSVALTADQKCVSGVEKTNANLLKCIGLSKANLAKGKSDKSEKCLTKFAAGWIKTRAKYVEAAGAGSLCDQATSDAARDRARATAILVGGDTLASYASFDSAALVGSGLAVEGGGGDLGEALAALSARLDTVELSLGDKAELPCATQVGDDVFFAGCNVHVRSGSGATDGTINGLGNLIVGYDEANTFWDVKSGSHNLVVGKYHTYSSYGGFVAGEDNRVTNTAASVSGGYDNHATGEYSSVSGGYDNDATGDYSSVSGGYANTAGGNHSSVSGGHDNEASETSSSVSGGYENEASGNSSSVSGGYDNLASGNSSSVSGGYDNTAGALTASVSGGKFNDAIGNHSSVSGGHDNEASGTSSSVSGGYDNTAGALTASVSGGHDNEASGTSSSVSGGYENEAGGNYSAVSGGSANEASGNYASVWGDGDALLLATIDTLQASSLTCATQSGDDVIFEGCNVHVRSGSGATDGAINGLGNLIVGYDEASGNPSTTEKSGSHNLVVGEGHSYPNYGGFIAGYKNKVLGIYTSVSGGHYNRASGDHSAVSGGYDNLAWGHGASVSGGMENEASGDRASVSGGFNNEASGNYSAVSGGYENLASGEQSSVSGGRENEASGDRASVSGGFNNEASGNYSAVSGGGGNGSIGYYSSVSGGAENITSGQHSSVSGGRGNGDDQSADFDWESGHYSSVSGGYYRTAPGNYDWVAGSLLEDQ